MTTYQSYQNATPGGRLTEREFRFCEQYLQEENQTRAYRLAGYRAKSDNVAAVEASRLLRKPKIQEYLAERTEVIREKIKKETEVTKERVIRELSVIAFSDIGDFITWGPEGIRFRDLHAIGPDKFAAVKSMQIKKGTRIITQVRFHNKLKALFLLAKHLGMFKK